MNWTELLKTRMAVSYAVTDGLLEMLSDEDLNWKPATGANWMTTGQLLMHLTTACGFCCRGFVTGEWGLPEDMDPAEMSGEDCLPPAEALPTLESVVEARRLLAEDKTLGLAMVDKAGEDALENSMSAAPWHPEEEKSLGCHLLNMISHLDSHKGQLFYYLKLMGREVNTQHLWGM